jgi:hypothetical protein
MTSLLLYGVVRGEHPLPDQLPLGAGDPPGPIRLIRDGPVAAVVSQVEDPVRLADEDAGRHLDVLVELLAGGPVLPLRLGSVAPDEEAVRAEVLAPARTQLRQRLDALDGLVEVHVDADEDELTAIRAVLDANPSLAGARGGTDVGSRMALGERVADGVVARRVEQGAQLLDELRPFCLADAPRGPTGGPEDPVLRWAFLVHGDARRRTGTAQGPAPDLTSFDQAVDRARRDHPQLVIEYVGPLPAFHFVGSVGTFEAADEPAHSRWGW